MQVFVPYSSPIEVAKCLDRKRLYKQVLECRQILNAISGISKAWANHPVVKMYSKHKMWLYYYMNCLACFCYGGPSQYWSDLADMYKPFFLTEEFQVQHRRRLYTKSLELYPQFAKYGTSEENWYYVDGKLVRYIKGKMI